MKNEFRVLGIIVLTAVIVFSILACEEIEDKGNDLLNVNGWGWETYTDALDGGTSTINMTRGIDSNSDKLTFSGTVEYIPGKFPGFVGWNAFPNDENLVELKETDAISFKFKGDGNYYKVQIGTTDVKDYDYFRYVFETTGEEQTIVIPYSQFKQEGWGTKVELNKNNITHIAFQANSLFIGGDFFENNGNFYGTGEGGEFSITIWDLQAFAADFTVGSTTGSLTISGIDEKYNGKWAWVMTGGIKYTEDDGDGLMGAQSISRKGVFAGGLISNGSVTLNVWKIIHTGDDSDDFDLYMYLSFENFNFSGTYGTNYIDGNFGVVILNKPTISIFDIIFMEDDLLEIFIAGGNVPITGNFSNGQITGTFIEE